MLEGLSVVVVEDMLDVLFYCAVLVWYWTVMCFLKMIYV